MTEYTALSKFLHRLALGQTLIAETSFDIERILFGKDASDLSQQKHVFIAGLARAGTTILMRSLYETDEFCSLTYRDMPFVLAPNLWSKLSKSGRLEMDATERAHGDGIKVDYDSPEALEEVFWRVFTGKQYIGKDGLSAYNASPAVIDDFRQYIALIAKKYHKQRYLSKNNNNILRIPTLQTAFPNAIILIPFREPLQHANSLLQQHRQFSARHTNDAFSKHYMTWLAHHEFGADHRAFIWDKSTDSAYNTESLNYWLSQWLQVYSELFKNTSRSTGNVIFVSYALLCKKTDSAWPKLKQQLDLSSDLLPALTLKETTIAENNDSDLLSTCNQLYDKLQQLSAEQLDVTT